MRRGERNLGLRFDSQRTENLEAEVAGALARVLKKDALADARLSAKDERAAPLFAGRAKRRVDARALHLAAEEHVREA
jgi:hypothetical protein